MRTTVTTRPHKHLLRVAGDIDAVEGFAIYVEPERTARYVSSKAHAGDLLLFVRLFLFPPQEKRHR